MKYLVFSQHIRKSEEFGNVNAAVNIIMDYNGEMTFAKAYDKEHEKDEGDVPKTAKELKTQNKREYFKQLRKHIKEEGEKLAQQLSQAKAGDVIDYYLCEIKVIDDGSATGARAECGCCSSQEF